MRVHIIGPNLPDQSKGSFHIHAEGCTDVQRDPQYAAFLHDREYTWAVTSRLNAAAEVYADQIAEGTMTAHDGLADLYFAPCTVPGLPYSNDADETHVVVSGSPIDGITLWGPFPSTPDATEFAERELGHDNWWVTKLSHPKEV